MFSKLTYYTIDKANEDITFRYEELTIIRYLKSFIIGILIFSRRDSTASLIVVYVPAWTVVMPHAVFTALLMNIKQTNYRIELVINNCSL